MPYEAPIYDRTNSDVEYSMSHQFDPLDLKGALNVSDLNRIESNTVYLNKILKANGYSAPIVAHSAWVMSDILYLEDMDRIRQNVINLVTAFTNFSNTPTIVLGNYRLGIKDINDVEKVIYDINILLENMINEFRYSGTIYAGGYIE